MHEDDDGSNIDQRLCDRLHARREPALVKSHCRENSEYQVASRRHREQRWELVTENMRIVPGKEQSEHADRKQDSKGIERD